MSKFEWTADGRIIYAGHDKLTSGYHADGELLAHFDDDGELILDAEENWSLDLEGCDLKEALADDAMLALREDGLLPEQWADFNWENFACWTAGLEPWFTTLEQSKTCKQCGAIFTRDDMNANNPWGKEKYFQAARICAACVKTIEDPVAGKWDIFAEDR